MSDQLAITVTVQIRGKHDACPLVYKSSDTAMVDARLGTPAHIAHVFECLQYMQLIAIEKAFGYKTDQHHEAWKIEQELRSRATRLAEAIRLPVDIDRLRTEPDYEAALQSLIVGEPKMPSKKRKSQ